MLSIARLLVLLAVQSVGAMRLSPMRQLPDMYEASWRLFELRFCVLETFYRWPRLRDTYGCGEGRSSGLPACSGDASTADYSNEHDAATKSLNRIWGVEDELAARKEHANFIQKKIGNFKDDENRTIHQEKQELKKFGFSYTKAQKRCRKGYTDDFLYCMFWEAKELGRSKVALETAHYMDKKEYMSVRSNEGSVVPRIYFNRTGVDRAWLPWAAYYDVPPSPPLHSWSSRKKLCMEQNEEHRHVGYHLRHELMREEVDGQCNEASCSRACPEGMYAGRPGTGTLAGFKALSAKIFKGVGATAGGTAAAEAGLMSDKGFFLPVLVAKMEAFYAGREFGSDELFPSRCACLPLTCKFSEETQSCYLAANPGDTGHNSTRYTVPMWSTKCAKHATNKKQCELQPCVAPDFEPQLKADEYGKKGQLQENGTAAFYNCLSRNGLPSGDVNVRGSYSEIYQHDAKQLELEMDNEEVDMGLDVE